ncbi:MAG: hypothetical protein IPP64_04910 [Bacteroidetes bacterium]|nr:hypothetical protein [Bacteroidota bacterium]
MEPIHLDRNALNNPDKKKEISESEQEGSLLTIEKPQDKQTKIKLKTEKEIEQLDADQETTKKNNDLRISFSFFSNIQQNKTNYIY